MIRLVTAGRPVPSGGRSCCMKNARDRTSLGAAPGVLKMERGRKRKLLLDKYIIVYCRREVNSAWI